MCMDHRQACIKCGAYNRIDQSVCRMPNQAACLCLLFDLFQDEIRGLRSRSKGLHGLVHGNLGLGSRVA